MSDSDTTESGATDENEELDDSNTDATSAIEHEDGAWATQLIDDSGNLFGVVNVIDALVVLLILTVVAAGLMLVLGGDTAGSGTGTDTTNATLDFGTQPENIISAINEGDTAPGLTITDVYIVPDGDKSRVLARVEITGSVSGETFRYDGAPLRLGRSLQVATNRYKISGAVRGVGNGSTLNIAQTELVVAQTIDDKNARELTVGDEFRIDNRVIGTVESVRKYATADPDQVRVVVGLAVETLIDGDTVRYGLTPVVRGSEIRLPAAGYQLNGRIIAIGRTEPPGTAATRTVTLRLSEVRDEIADTYQPGMAEVVGDETTAEITTVDVEPSTVVTTSETGEVKANDHPIDRDVTMTAELSVRETESGILFKGKRIQRGTQITLDLGSTTIRPTVVRIR